MNRTTVQHYSRIWHTLRNFRAAIDLASIMVGVIIIGIIGGVIAATVFAVIPWAQDRAAEQSLAAVADAESATLKDGKFTGSDGLNTAGYLKLSPKMAVSANPAGTCWIAVAKSDSGPNYFYTTDKIKTPKPYTAGDESETSYCPAATGLVDLVGTLGGPQPPVMKLVVDTALNDAGRGGTTCKNFTLPIRHTVNATVDWGDGTTVQTVTTQLPNHTYATTGQFNVVINGTFDRYGAFDVTTDSYGAGATASTGCIPQVSQWGPTGTDSAIGAYAYFPGVTGVVQPPTTVTRYDSMFYNATNFNQNINTWKTGNVEMLGAAFFNATAYNQPLDKWDTSHVKSLEATFQSSAFDSDISTWDVRNVLSMRQTFCGSPFNHPLNNWKTSSLQSISYIFQADTAFNQPLDKWDVSHVTNMASAFSYSLAFNQDISGWDTGQVADMFDMFDSVAGFNRDLSNWNVNNVTSHYWFEKNSGLTAGNLPHWVS